MIIKNFMEEAVFGNVDKVISNNNYCNCEKCRFDVAAIALNNLKPHYFVTDQGELYAKLDELTLQYSADVFSALQQAADTVKAYPRHNDYL